MQACEIGDSTDSVCGIFRIDRKAMPACRSLGDFRSAVADFRHWITEGLIEAFVFSRSARSSPAPKARARPPSRWIICLALQAAEPSRTRTSSPRVVPAVHILGGSREQSSAQRMLFQVGDVRHGCSKCTKACTHVRASEGGQEFSSASHGTLVHYPYLVKAEPHVAASGEPRQRVAGGQECKQIPSHARSSQHAFHDAVPDVPQCLHLRLTPRHVSSLGTLNLRTQS